MSPPGDHHQGQLLSTTLFKEFVIARLCFLFLLHHRNAGKWDEPSRVERQKETGLWSFFFQDPGPEKGLCVEGLTRTLYSAGVSRGAKTLLASPLKPCCSSRHELT